MPNSTLESQTAPFSNVESVMDDTQVLGQYIPLLYHYNMLQDEDRVGAFQSAIELVVQPGMHVVELGGGTGILSSLAARRGAHVSCVERNPELVDCANRFVRANELDDQIRVIQADATRFVPEQPVDVVICEMLHVGLLREKQASVIAGFKQGYARKHGPQLPIFIPEASILMAQPVQHSFEFAGYIAPVPTFQAPLLEQPRTQELASLSPYASISYNEPVPTRFEVCQTLAATASGTANAVRFVTQNVLAIDMQAESAITWPNQCLVLPIDRDFDVQRDSKLELKFAYKAGDPIERLMETIGLSQANR